jgi:Tat protein translocase TatB subunit
MFNIGTPELLLVLVIAMVVVGPERLPELARWIGRGMRELRKVQDDVKDMVQTGMGDDFAEAANEVKGAVTEMRKSASEMKRAAGLTATAAGQPHKARTPTTPVVRPDEDAEGPAAGPAPVRENAPETPKTEAPKTESAVENAKPADSEPGATAAE